MVHLYIFSFFTETFLINLHLPRISTTIYWIIFMMVSVTFLSDNSNICVILVLASFDCLFLGTWEKHSGRFPELSFYFIYTQQGTGEASNLETAVSTDPLPSTKNPQESPAVPAVPSQRIIVLMCLFYIWYPRILLNGRRRILHSILEPEVWAWILIPDIWWIWIMLLPSFL